MMAKSHAVIGLASWMIAAPSFHLLPWSPVALAMAAAGSLLPDIDHPASWVGRRTRPLSTLISSLFGHRGITHSAMAVVALSALLAHHGYSRSITGAFAVGYLSHLAADMLTPRGLRLAWPLRRTWGVPVCRTGSPAEALIVASLCLLAGIMIAKGMPSALLPHLLLQYWPGKH